MPPRSWLQHPLTRGLDLDDPRTTALRRRILEAKPFLRRIYDEWYAALAAELPSGGGRVVELGSGAGFLAERVPGLVRSEVFPTPNADLLLDATALPFSGGSLAAIVMTNVLHHVPRPASFFAEAARCVRPGGVVAMLEPWVTPWATLVYRHLHHEPFEPGAPSWELPAGGPLSGANGALPWILFERDRRRFDELFPAWRVRSIRPTMPLRYLLSGGLSLRLSMPGWSFALWRAAESALARWSPRLAMFAQVVLERRPDAPPAPQPRSRADR
jgi:SAM-dependent methyltransferase